MNKVILIGNVGRDPERKGEKVVAFSLATTENGYTKQDGTKVEDRTEWHNVTIFDPKLASFAEKYVRKGSRLILEGKIHYSDYTDKVSIHAPWEGCDTQEPTLKLQGYMFQFTHPGKGATWRGYL